MPTKSPMAWASLPPQLANFLHNFLQCSQPPYIHQSCWISYRPTVNSRYTQHPRVRQKVSYNARFQISTDTVPHKLSGTVTKFLIAGGFLCYALPTSVLYAIRDNLQTGIPCLLTLEAIILPLTSGILITVAGAIIRLACRIVCIITPAHHRS